jgi:hypothetical protein
MLRTEQDRHTRRFLRGLKAGVEPLIQFPSRWKICDLKDTGTLLKCTPIKVRYMIFTPAEHLRLAGDRMCNRDLVERHWTATYRWPTWRSKWGLPRVSGA